MKQFLKWIILSMGLLLWFGCDNDTFTPIPDDELELRDAEKSLKATGDVDVQFFAQGGGNGGSGGDGGHHEEAIDPTADEDGSHDGGQHNALKFANVVFDAQEATSSLEAKGSFHLTIFQEMEMHRILIADVYDVLVDATTKEAWFVGLVVEDSNDCSAGGHDDGEHEDGGGCSGHDDEGGCSGHDGEEHEDGGGCSGHVGEEHDGGSGSDGGQGNRCRIGQKVAVHVYDGGSPGTNGDEISWKWIKGHGDSLPMINDIHSWESLHPKEIVGGNLVVHTK